MSEETLGPKPVRDNAELVNISLFTDSRLISQRQKGKLVTGCKNETRIKIIILIYGAGETHLSA